MKILFLILIIFQVVIIIDESFGCFVSNNGKDYDGCGVTSDQACATLLGCLEQPSNPFGLAILTAGEQYEGAGFCGITNGAGTSLSNSTNLIIDGNSATIICQDTFFLRWFVNSSTIVVNVGNLTVGLCSSDGDGGCISVDALHDIAPTLQVIVQDVIVFNATSKGKGGGLAIMNPFLQFQILHCSFSNCQSGSHGGAFYSPRDPLVFANNSFSYNSAKGNGGAVYFEEAEAGSSFTDCFFIGNTANLDGGAFWLGSSARAAVRSFLRDSFIGNQATHGGALATPGLNTSASYNTQTQFQGCSFSRNQARSAGGALYSANRCAQWNGVNFIVIDSQFSQNSAGTDGGAMATYCGIFQLHSSTFVENIAMANGGATSSLGLDVYKSEFNANQAQGYGGGIALINASCVIGFSSTNITQNKAKLGGGVAVILNNDALPYSKDFYLSFRNTTFVNNAATTNGGGMYLQNYLTDSSLFQESTFESNSALQNGGAIAVDQLTATSIQFSIPLLQKNTAGVSGGGIFINSSSGPLSLQGQIQSNLPDQVGCGPGSSFCQNATKVSQCIFCSALCAIDLQTITCYENN